MFVSISNFRARGAEPAAEPSADCERRPAKMRAGFRRSSENIPLSASMNTFSVASRCDCTVASVAACKLPR